MIRLYYIRITHAWLAEQVGQGPGATTSFLQALNLCSYSPLLGLKEPVMTLGQEPNFIAQFRQSGISVVLAKEESGPPPLT